ncbi:MAG TPA: xanthine dehydrogenase family protein molybdopterin-binding subunit [Methylomirabilota bacterium]|jgi:carbon-monoxide dehydrogenase large subunit|nr:xanthine dehydrogenase family protein molybdopterin-binding subunit [Methylomirabilota bacterium]
MASRYVSRSIKRTEDPPLLMGRAHFIGDLRVSGLRAVAFLRSPHAHARIVAIDVSAALGMAGVEAVVTGADLAATTRPIRAAMSGAGYKETGWPALAVGKARFAGEPVAAVVAADQYRAEDALEAIRVTWDPLPAVADAEASMRPDAPRLHEEIADNIIFHTHFENGAVEQALASSDIRISETFRHRRCSSVPMEPRGVMAAVDPVDGMLTVWASTQSPHLMRSGLAEALGLPDSRIRVLCPAVGGGFGPKMHLYPEDIVVAQLARRLRHPVRWLEDRRENLLSSAQARDHVNHVEIGARKDGTLLALRSTLICDSGAYSVYPVTASLEPLTAAGILPGPYKLPALAYDAYAVATNKCPAGAYRGVGMALGTFVRERLVDMIARRAGLDPAEVRRRNFVDAKELPFATASRLVVDSGDFRQSLERALEAGDYTGLRAQPRHTPAGKYRGIGVAAYTEFTGMGSGTFRLRGMRQVSGHDAATVRVEATGEVRAFVSAASQGQGHATTLAQVLADELGVDLAAVTIVEGDTERCPYGSGSFASRSMVVSGGALILAARRVREKIAKIAGHMLEAAPEDLEIEEGAIAVRGAPGRTLTIAEVAALAYRPAGGTLPAGVDPALEATQYYDPPPATFSNGSHVAVVEVDAETGQVAVVRHVVVEDCGRIVNPMIVDGQTHGAVAQGIGNALYEEIAYDDTGQPLTTTFMDYLIPGTMEVPPMDIIHMETPPAVTVSGFKGMAEGGTIGSTAAVANAVADALAPLGVEVRELPLTPDRVYRLIKEAKP